MFRLAAARRATQLRGPSANPLIRLYSITADAPPPLLLKLKSDLKAAMRTRDTSRLLVVRAILAAHHNASKTATPARTDVQLIALVRKLQKSSQDAIAEAAAAGREDLVEKERAEVQIMEEYIAGSDVQTLGEAELRAAVQEAVEASRGAGTAPKSLMGDVMKRISAFLEGKDVDKKSVAAIAKELTSR
ncbi:Altered inheritance of mitochondria protein 41 [Escovopsis weberi]|uniref:Altered inheritance of mitochondria protein 41 n=1 Tax=Escovopsis weberi TaxID=150374 RepID=A0A0M8MTA8_ESCWE|nr:Altered inheritance of mitochondria protein 41 [Escovopsis weberi]